MQPTGSSTRVRIEFAQHSDPGRDPNKQVNEDSCGYAETKLGHAIVLCDGMGGHYGGREASQTAIGTIFEVLERTAPGVPPSAALKAAIEEAGRRVYRLGGPPENRTRPGSTVVAMILHDRGVDVAHVGDSRAYVIRSNQIYPLTRDHSMVQGMIDAGMLTEAQAIGHPDANKITRALGMKPEVEVEVRPEPMELYAGDVLMMSSDGLTDLAVGADILGCTRQALASGSVDHACKMLVKLANDRGGHDNITVQMARVVETGGRSLTIPQGPQGPQGPQSAAAPGAAPAPTAAGLPQETIAMTKPGEAPAAPGAPSARLAAPPAAAPAPTAPGTAPPGPVPQWAPVAPTAADGALRPEPTHPGAPAGAARTTEPGAPIDVSRPAAPGLAPYRMDAGPNQLPLPPPATASYLAAAQHNGQPMMPGAAPLYAGAPGAEARPSRGGIVFVIIGLSAVIAVLLVLLLWALLP